ncbi:MAG: AMP-binding protein [Rhodospirillaceae bacterium]
MTKLTEYTTYADAQAHYVHAALWDLFDGSRERINIAHECIDRHAAGGATAVNVVTAGAATQALSFREIAEKSSQFAHALEAQGIEPGERVAVMLEPSLAYYVALFGAMKMGAVAVPLFTLFGPDGIRLRVDDCRPRLLITDAAKAADCREIEGPAVQIADDAWLDALSRYPADYAVDTKGDDLAALQYTSGTTRQLPDAVRHTHRSIVTLMNAALYGTGIRPGDVFFCPSSPAWGHGLWHGTLAPLALGVTTGTFAGRFDPVAFLEALQDLKITNLSAAATHFRLAKNTGRAGDFTYAIDKLSFTGEPIDADTADFIAATFGVPACSMYGTTEVGVILANYPGAPDIAVKPGSLGKPVPGVVVEVHRPDGTVCDAGELGEIVVKRRDAWFRTKDLGKTDTDGHFYHGGRADDVIISAGWTMSAVEIEDAILKHADVLEAAVIGVPDDVRGQVVKAYVVSGRAGGDAFATEIQDGVRARLSQHEYPRQVAFVAELPKTPAGKINRKALRDAEAAAT